MAPSGRHQSCSALASLWSAERKATTREENDGAERLRCSAAQAKKARPQAAEAVRSSPSRALPDWRRISVELIDPRTGLTVRSCGERAHARISRADEFVLHPAELSAVHSGKIRRNVNSGNKPDPAQASASGNPTFANPSHKEKLILETPKDLAPMSDAKKCGVLKRFARNGTTRIVVPGNGKHKGWGLAENSGEKPDEQRRKRGVSRRSTEEF